MKVYDIASIVNMDFNVKFLNALKQFWRGKKEFQCISAPKTQDIILCFHGCKATYVDKQQNVFNAESGDLVYAPKGSEYSVIFYDFENEESHTSGINFLLFDSFGEEITLSDKIQIFHPVSRKVSQIIEKMVDEDAALSYLKKRAYLFEALSLLDTSASNIDELIYPGFSYLSEHFDESTPISELAKLCNVSEVYFRKRFNEFFGSSPVEYRNRLRLEKAKEYLEYGDVSIQEISDLVGYSTASNFIKEFRKTYDMSPLGYRKKCRSGEK